MSKTYYVPTVLLRCNKCHNQTPHLLIDLINKPRFGITLTYECQMCGETKKAFYLNTLPEFTSEQVQDTATQETKEPIREPIAIGVQ